MLDLFKLKGRVLFLSFGFCLFATQVAATETKKVMRFSSLRENVQAKRVQPAAFYPGSQNRKVQAVTIKRKGDFVPKGANQEYHQKIRQEYDTFFEPEDFLPEE